MAAPTADKIILPLDTGNTGKNVRTQLRTVGGIAVHEHYFVQGRRPGEFFRSCMFGSTYNGFAAGTATAGHIYAFRWGSSTHAARLCRILVTRQLLAGFTAAQELATALYRLTGYTASHTGGTAATLTSPNCKKDTSGADTKVTQIMITSGAALTAGTHTLDAQPFAAGSSWDAITTTLTQHGGPRNLVEWDDNNHEVTLRQNQGFIVRNEVLMGAGGVVRPIVEVDWEEVLLADLDL
jgi:hypothetical protein